MEASEVLNHLSPEGTHGNPVHFIGQNLSHGFNPTARKSGKHRSTWMFGEYYHFLGALPLGELEGV